MTNGTIGTGEVVAASAAKSAIAEVVAAKRASKRTAKSASAEVVAAKSERDRMNAERAVATKEARNAAQALAERMAVAQRSPKSPEARALMLARAIGAALAAEAKKEKVASENHAAMLAAINGDFRATVREALGALETMSGHAATACGERGEYAGETVKGSHFVGTILGTFYRATATDKQALAAIGRDF